MDWALYCIGAYVAGSIPFGLLVARARGVNLREVGSGNIGATNVGRALGRPYAVLVFILDFAKGFLPVWIGVLHGLAPWTLVAIAILAVAGHNYPIWLKFEGGKGVATSGGVLAALLPLTAGVAILLWAVVFLATRYVSVASLACAISLPITTYFYRPEPAYLVLTGTLLVLGFIRHRSNIAALIDGTEHRFDRKQENSSTS